MWVFPIMETGVPAPGKLMEKVRENLLRFTGSMEQVAYVREVMFCEGRAQGLKAYEMNNGVLFARVLEGKAMDMEELSFCGMGMNYLSKPGVQAPGPSDISNWDPVRSIMGGFFFTAGLRNIGPTCETDGETFPMHGRLRSTPAEHTGSYARWEGDRYVLGVHGVMREASLFGENLSLTRTIRTGLGEAGFEIHDVIENENCRPEPLFLLYHFNLGYPFLLPGSTLTVPSVDVKGRDEISGKHLDEWQVMGPAADGEPERVFIHELAADEDGTTAVMMDNGRGLGVQIAYPRDVLPVFMQWQSLGSGDYVTGLEPASASVYGRAHDKEEGYRVVLEPFAQYEVTLHVSLLAGEQQLEASRARIRALV